MRCCLCKFLWPTEPGGGLRPTKRPCSSLQEQPREGLLGRSVGQEGSWESREKLLASLWPNLLLWRKKISWHFLCREGQGARGGRNLSWERCRLRKRGNQHSFPCDLVRIHDIFANSVSDRELKWGLQLGNKTRDWFNGWAEEGVGIIEERKTTGLAQPQKLECSWHKQTKISNKRTHTPKCILGKPNYWALSKIRLKVLFSKQK